MTVGTARSRTRIVLAAGHGPDEALSQSAVGVGRLDLLPRAPRTNHVSCPSPTVARLPAVRVRMPAVNRVHHFHLRLNVVHLVFSRRALRLQPPLGDRLCALLGLDLLSQSKHLKHLVSPLLAGVTEIASTIAGVAGPGGRSTWRHRSLIKRPAGRSDNVGHPSPGCAGSQVLEGAGHRRRDAVRSVGDRDVGELNRHRRAARRLEVRGIRRYGEVRLPVLDRNDRLSASRRTRSSATKRMSSSRRCAAASPRPPDSPGLPVPVGADPVGQARSETHRSSEMGEPYLLYR